MRRSIRSQAASFSVGGFHGRLGGRFQPVEEQQHQAAVLGNRLRAQRRLRDQGQRPFAADQQPGQIELRRLAARRAVITAAVHPGLRLVGSDHGVFALDQLGQAANDFAAARIGIDVRIVGDRMAGRFEHFAIGQHHLHAHDVPAGGAVAEPVAAAVIQGQHAAHRRHAAGRRIGPELPAERRQIPIELPEHDARLHSDRVAVSDVHDPPHRLREIEDQPRPQRLARQTRARPAGMDGNGHSRRIANGRLHIGHAPRPDHPQRPHLIDAGVGGVHLHERVVAMDLARKSPRKSAWIRSRC